MLNLQEADGKFYFCEILLGLEYLHSQNAGLPWSGMRVPGSKSQGLRSPDARKSSHAECSKLVLKIYTDLQTEISKINHH